MSNPQCPFKALRIRCFMGDTCSSRARVGFNGATLLGVVGMKYQQVVSAVRILMEDHLVEHSSGVYRLSPLGQSVLPYVKELVGWCEMQIKC